jgi:hypothetical protein
MLKSVVLFVVALMGVMLLPAVASANDLNANNHFVAHLTAAQEVPAVASTATGEASFTITDKDTAIRFRISSRGLDRILQSHIHVGARGATGPVFVFLFPLAEHPVSGKGWSVSGTLTAADLIPQPGAATFAQALASIRAGNTYANIHTVAHPGGEIRGQLMQAQDE